MRPNLSKKRSEESPLWLIIFSDMSTNLMMFFLMLFAMTRMNAYERQMIAEGMKEAMQSDTEIVKELETQEQKEQLAIATLSDVISYGKLSRFATLDVKDDKVKLTLMMPLVFESGSSEIYPGAVEFIESLVDPIMRFPGESIVEGHTDNVPIYGGRFSSNWELSVARAVSVIDFLVANGVPPEKLVAGGYGEFHPAHPNDTLENRSLNRRIEITFPRKEGITP